MRKGVKDTNFDNIRVETTNTRTFRYKLADNLNFIQENDVVLAITKNEEPMAVTLSFDLFLKLLHKHEEDYIKLIDSLGDTLLHESRSTFEGYYTEIKKILTKLGKTVFAQDAKASTELLSVSAIATDLKKDKPDLDVPSYDALIILIIGILQDKLINLPNIKSNKVKVVPNSFVTLEQDGEESNYFFTDLLALDYFDLHTITTTSRFGSLLLGRKQGETVTLKVPEGTKEYKILKVV